MSDKKFKPRTLKLVKYFWKRNIITFAIFSVLMIAIALFHLAAYKDSVEIPYLINKNGTKISNIILYPSYKVVENSNSKSEYYNMTISSLLSNSLFGTTSIVLLMVFLIIIFAKNFSGEVANTSMSTWLSLPYSRKKVLTSKLLGALSMMYLIVAMLVIGVVITSVIGTHISSSDIINVVAYGIEFSLFMLLPFSLITICNIIFISNKTMSIVVPVCIVIYIAITGILVSVYPLIKKEWLKDIKYIELQSLIANPLCVNKSNDSGVGVFVGSFQDSRLDDTLITNTYTYNVYMLKPVTDPIWKDILFPVLTTGVSSGLICVSYKKFNTMSLSI